MGFINLSVPSFLVEEFSEVVKFATFVLVQGKFERRRKRAERGGEAV